MLLPGISGDMVTAGSCWTWGSGRVVLRKALGQPAAGWVQHQHQPSEKAGLDACDFDVVLDAEHENHDHDMAYLYGGVEECGHTHDVHEHNHDEHDHHHDEDGHEHRHGHCCHDHAAEHSHDHEHDHAHRGLAEVLDILNKADLTDRARATAVRIFTILGQAEAKAHGATLETVHFHEVGAVDSIVDITAAAVCLDNLGIEDVIVPVLYEGTGQHPLCPRRAAHPGARRGEHCRRGAPEPAHHRRQGRVRHPHRAAIAAAVRTSDQLPAEFTVSKIGLGAGKREQELPGLVRAMLIRPAGSEYAAQDVIYKLESNIDDTTGEALGYVMERLLAAGCTGRAVQPGLHEKEPSCVPFDRALPGGGHSRTGRNHFCGDHHHRHPPRADGAQHLEAPYLHHSHLTG